MRDRILHGAINKYSVMEKNNINHKQLLKFQAFMFLNDFYKINLLIILLHSKAILFFPTTDGGLYDINYADDIFTLSHILRNSVIDRESETKRFDLKDINFGFGHKNATLDNFAFRIPYMMT